MFHLSIIAFAMALLAAYVAVLAAVLCVLAIIYLIHVLALWKIFKKMELQGWKTIIPFYSDFAWAKEVWSPKFVVCMWGAFFLYNFVGSHVEGKGFVAGLLSVISLLFGIIFIALRARFCYWIAKSFGFEGAFAIGLFFMTPLFELITGFGHSTYVGNHFKKSGAKI